MTRCLASTLSPGRAVSLITSPIPAPQFPGCAMGMLSQMCLVSPLGSRCLATTLPEDVDCQGSQEDFVHNWEPTHSVVEDAISGAEIAPFRLWLSPACLSALGGGWAGPQLASSPLVVAKSFVL